jgi:PAS domain S-box-containing protein
MIRWRDSILSFCALPEAATLLLAAAPAWIFADDGSRVLWANPAGGARLGAREFASLWERRWPRRHPLRREVESLARWLSDAGTLARLRIGEALPAVPTACRVRRVRTAEVRGILLVAEAGSKTETCEAELARFFSDASAGAAIFDASGGVVAEGSDGAAGELAPDVAYVELSGAGRRLRLYLPQPKVQPDASDAPAHEAAATIDEAPASPDEPAVSIAGPERPPEEAPPDRHDAEPSASVPDEKPPATSVRLVRPPGAAPKTDESVARRSRPPPNEPPAPEPASRPIVAGRVARELSRNPVRFLWQTDAADRLLFVSPGLAQVVGRNSEIVGERWPDAAARLRLDPTQRIAKSLANRDTWSGLTAWWPVEGSEVRVPAELTALPIYAGDHSFQGYRGFGVLKPAEALMPAAFEARFGPPARTPAEQIPPYEEAVATIPGNVVPIRADVDVSADTRLTAQERSAFEEIAAALRRRVLEERPPEQPTDQAAQAASDQSPTGPYAAPGQATREEAPAEDVPSAEAAGGAAAGPSAPVEEEPSSDAPMLEPRGDEAPALGESAAPEMLASAEKSAAPQRASAQLTEGEAHQRLRELTAILDTATDGVIILDGEGRIESANASAEALFGLDAQEMQGTDFAALLTDASAVAARDYLSGLKDNGVASLLNEGREVEARAGMGAIPLFMTMGRISGGEGGRYCAVLRDITHWKRSEGELMAAKRAAEAASRQKSDFLARVSHEIRTPLNAIIGFAEVMIEERFGPVENDRYREYLRDIRASGEHVVSLVNDLLDISKIEAGRLDLTFAAVPLNDLVRESIALMQPQANRARVVLRSSLSRDVPAIVADQRTLRQIVLNLLSNSVKFTGPGGQVIASTTLADSGEALLRIRDTGAGMSEEELALALEPFRQLNTATMSRGTGLGLPLTKALVEANRASFSIRSARGEGTVVTVAFPPTRVLSE